MNDKQVNVKIAKSSGFCFGVKRAIDLAQEVAVNNTKVYTYGPLIHNPQEVARLEQQNIKVIENCSKIRKGVLVLRTHGIPIDIYEKLANRKNIKIIDATCPFVKRAQDIVKQLSTNSKQIVVVGEREHPEIIALVSYGRGKCVVVENEKDIKNIKITDEVVPIVSQTTQNPKNFENIVKKISKKVKVKVFNTICRATFDRQSSAEKLAKLVDVMVVIGGKNSGNTTRLYQICKKITKTYHIETVEEVKQVWFKNINKIGITAGASTPDWIIESIKNKIEEFTNKK